MGAGYKTMIVNGVVLFYALISYFFGPSEDTPDVEAIAALVDQGTAVWLSLVAVVNGILRMVTRTPVFFRSTGAGS